MHEMDNFLASLATSAKFFGRLAADGKKCFAVSQRTAKIFLPSAVRRPKVLGRVAADSKKNAKICGILLDEATRQKFYKKLRLCAKKNSQCPYHTLKNNFLARRLDVLLTKNGFTK